jgi:hypothetical protein
VDGKKRGAGHAVLQARPRRTTERALSAREPSVERADPPPEGEDVRPRDIEPGPCHGSVHRAHLIKRLV